MNLSANSVKPRAEELVDLGDGIHAQILELAHRPTADGAEILAANLAGARLAILRFRERLVAEGEGRGHVR